MILLAAAAGAIAPSAGCGTLLAIAPDDVPASLDGAATDGGGDATAEGATADTLGAQLVPPSVVLVGTSMTSERVTVVITRPRSMPSSQVTVTFATGSGLTATPVTGTTATTGALLALDVFATGVAIPRRLMVDVTVTDGKTTVKQPLTVLVARHYRSGTIEALDLTGLPGAQPYTVEAWGAGGGDPGGGAGGFAAGTLMLAPSTYLVAVGTGAPAGGAGGVPGGGSTTSSNSRGGGGFSGLFVKGADLALVGNRAQVVAGAGGGACADGTLNSGGAGGTTDLTHAEDGVGSVGSGALTTAGGTGALSSGGVVAENGGSGASLAGGNGGADTATRSGGGGGGGYWGGGGGAVNSNAGGCTGGGGGSSFVLPTATGISTKGGRGSTPGNAGDPLRGTAGGVGKDGAVLVIPQ